MTINNLLQTGGNKMNIQWKKIYIYRYPCLMKTWKDKYFLFLLCILVPFSPLSLPLLSPDFLLLPSLLPHHFSVLSLNLVVKFIETMLQVWGKEVKQTVFTMPKTWDAKGKSSFQFRNFSSLLFHIKKALESKRKKSLGILRCQIKFVSLA